MSIYIIPEWSEVYPLYSHPIKGITLTKCERATGLWLYKSKLPRVTVIPWIVSDDNRKWKFAFSNGNNRRHVWEWSCLPGYRKDPTVWGRLIVDNPNDENIPAIMFLTECLVEIDAADIPYAHK